jgi:threonine synthase
MLARRGGIALGQEVNFCVPTGNFGNILAGYYARAMGLPVKKFICASNQNNILADFFATGIYDRNRPFFRTTSPSMDILISSNLERFLFEITGHDGHQVAQWYEQLGATGRFAVDSATRAAMDECIAAGWVDEQRVKATIARTFRDHRYVLDTHSAVAVAVDEDFGDSKVPTIIDSTASPYKFSADVLGALSEERFEDEFASIQRLSELSATPIHRGVQGLREKPLRHSKVIALQGMKDAVIGELASRLA